MRNAIIMGAAGRDFHNFNEFFRNKQDIEVVAFTATQIPDIEGRKYPTELAGELYPEGIDIYPESELFALIKKFDVHDVYFSYSDVSYQYVMGKAADVMKAGANFVLLGPNETMIKSSKPVISVCAVRTGCGKSQTTRKVASILRKMGYKVAAIRHPMPYGDLAAQKVQKFATLDDLKKHNCTIEEMEEYEPHIKRGVTVFAGVDYRAILEEAEKVADLILWDGGNNDFPFYKADLEIVVADPHRPGHELEYYPGEVNFKRADVIVINKIDTADLDNILELRENISEFNKDAIVVDAASPIFVEGGKQIRNKRVLVIEDGPTLTHGEMEYGAGVMAAYKYGAAELVDPREYAVGTIAETYEEYPEIGILLPAMGYGDQQMKDLEATINKVDADLVIIGTPIDLGRIVNFKKPTVRVTYELEEIGTPTLEEILKDKFEK
ncbi:MAG: GTPase [Candidatus Aminicenantes bacterium]|nr:GTPase [Candidatus Aminicenantes bacterium]NIM79643.1 GTPase [Candidatus Aminicenantes bacterium]NIN18969.1 GTPase [Candidatus Aminicenantes bacterium]NIN42871.1 GTPase [Candidatus Aminicenantes bacterium]NIN85608.1 GTPase [Candidatus Aminicenantes bacterium]